MTGKYTVLREFMSTPIILKPGLPSLGNQFICVEIVCDMLFVVFGFFSQFISKKFGVWNCISWNKTKENDEISFESFQNNQMIVVFIPLKIEIEIGLYDA